MKLFYATKSVILSAMPVMMKHAIARGAAPRVSSWNALSGSYIADGATGPPSAVNYVGAFKAKLELHSMTRPNSLH